MDAWRQPSLAALTKGSIMHHVNESNRTRALCAVVSLIVCARAAWAQDAPPPPTYPDPLTSLQGAQGISFSHWGVAPAISVPKKALQAVINAEGGSGFVALEDSPGSGVSTVNLTAVNERTQQRTLDGAANLVSAFSVTAAMLNTNVSPPRVETGFLLVLGSDPDLANSILGGNVTTPGKFDWEIEQEDGSQVLKVEVRGPNRFRVVLESTIDAEDLGFRIVNDPVRLDPGDPGSPVAVSRFLTDGRGGAHPTVSQASQGDLIPVAEGRFRGLVPGGTLSLPGGILPIRQVLPGFVLRSYADRLEHADVQ